MKKNLVLLFSFVTLLAFVTVNIAIAQQLPKTDKKTDKVELTIEKKSVEPCCETKGQATGDVKADCCSQTAEKKAVKPCCETKGQTTGEAKSDCCTSKDKTKVTGTKVPCGSTGKPCGGCSSKSSPQSERQLPVPRR